MAEQNNTDCPEDETISTIGNDNDNNEMRTAKNIMTRVITKALNSIPGYNILENYKDHICASLPDDYNNTALRLQSLIKASDHMIKWILIGEPSKANHRIYQVVLVFVCFEPHFIKFCDIMEVLAADSGCIMELRKTLIKQLHRDKYITAEEASQLTSTKLFTAPDTVKSVTRTTNFNTSNTNGAFTSVLLDQHGQLQHLSVGETLPPVIVEVSDAYESSNYAPVTSTSVQYTVQSLQSTNAVDVTENLIDGVLQHISSDSEHGSILLAHNQQNATTEDVENTGIIKSDDPQTKCRSLSEEATLLTPVHAKTSGTEMNGIQEDILCTADEEIFHEPKTLESSASLATTVGSTDVSDNLKSDKTSCIKPMSSLAEEDKIDAVDYSKPQAKAVSDEVKIDTDTLSEEVHDILAVKDFAVVKTKYTEILSSLPENYEVMMGSLQDHLTVSQICDILSLTDGHTQKILNCLILQLRNKEDLLDFCDHLEKIQEASPSLKVIVEQLRKETIEMIQAAPNPEQLSSSTEKAETTIIPIAPPARPPHKYLPFHPALLLIPKEIYPFDSYLSADDSEGLAALKKCYSILIESLPSNHLISLLRLQDVAIIPEEIVDSIVPSPSAEVGNKMIINYLIGLIHTEEHIIIFCNFAERMVGEFDKCICVLNLRNTVKMGVDLKENDTTITDSTNFVTQLFDASSLSSTKDAVLPSEVVEVDDKNATNKYFGGTSINSIVKLTKNSDSGPPYLHKSGIMTGFKQAVIIITNGDKYEETIKAVPLENPSQNSTDENSAAMSYVRKDIDLVKSYFKKDINKELSFTLHDGPDTQKSRKFYIECLEILFKECSTAGVTIYYTGYGEEETGNWCFKDGTISFQDIFTLYKEYCKGKVLCIFADCCYSGQWVLDCAKSLDEMGIGACGHKAREQGMLLKIFTSCYPNQKATLDCYITNKGMYLNEEDNSIWLFYNKKISDTQTTHGYDFTKIHCLQMEGPTAPCRYPDIPAKCSWKWEDIVSIENKNRPSSLIYTVRGTDRGRKAWHLVLVERQLHEDFCKNVSTGTIDVAKYGYVIKSGWGENPPDDILDKIKKYSPN